MYKVFLYILVFSILAFIVWDSFFWIQVKITLSLIALTFLPVIRKKLYNDDALFRKGKAALYASLLVTALGLILTISSIIKENGMDLAGLWLAVFLFIILLFGCVVYGIPASSFSDLATSNVKRYRFPLAFLIHLGFGLLSYLFLGPLMYFALIVAVVFFLFDEFFRKRETTRSLKSLA